MTSEIVMPKQYHVDRLDLLWDSMVDATAARDADRVKSIDKEISATTRKIAEFDSVAERDARDTACTTAASELSKFKMGDIAKSIVLTGTLRKTDTGWDDLKIGVTVPDSVTEQFHNLFPVDLFESLKTVRGVSFTIGPDGATVESTGRKTSSGSGGGGGRGYVKDGVTVKLGDVFDAYATPAQKDEIVGMDGNKSYALKVHVALAAGFVQNGK
jgi:hypothetical protein